MRPDAEESLEQDDDGDVKAGDADEIPEATQWSAGGDRPAFHARAYDDISTAELEGL